MSDTSYRQGGDVTAIRRNPGVGHQSLGSCIKCDARTQKRYPRGPFMHRYCGACAAEYDAKKAAK